MRSRRGLAVRELAAAVCVVVVGLAVVMPGAGRARAAAMSAGSMDNLRVMGEMTSFYAFANDGAIPSYSWKGGVQYQVAGAFSPSTPSSDSSAHALQNLDILRRLTGRESGATRILSAGSRLVDSRASHLILADFFGWPANFEIFHAPGDVNLQRWASDPLDLSTVPYSGASVPPGYDQDANWTRAGVRQRWAYSSSYIWVPFAWMPDSSPTYVPIPDSPHLFFSIGGSVPLGGRQVSQVAFPGNKVFVYEEHDWKPFIDAGTGQLVSDGVHFAYPRARVAKLMFDGSVHRHRSGEARAGYSPADHTRVWTARHRPLATFPGWADGDPVRELDYTFKWTRHGLQGVDYVPAEVPGLGDDSVFTGAGP